MLVEATEQTILLLIDGSLDWASMIYHLETFAEQRRFHKGMEEHHIEPERERTVFLWPLEHLAIHICHAKLSPTDSNHAKVGAFVKPFPGSYRRIVSLTDKIYDLVLSFGQTRPSKTVEEMTRIANLPQAKLAQQLNGSLNGAINGKKGAPKVSDKLKGREITWGDKIGIAMSNLPKCSCTICHSEMAHHKGNIEQHVNSPKCIPYDKIVMQCILCHHPFTSNNQGTLTRHVNSSKCK